MLLKILFTFLFLFFLSCCCKMFFNGINQNTHERERHGNKRQEGQRSWYTAISRFTWTSLFGVSTSAAACVTETFDRRYYVKKEIRFGGWSVWNASKFLSLPPPRRRRRRKIGRSNTTKKILRGRSNRLKESHLIINKYNNKKKKRGLVGSLLTSLSSIDLFLKEWIDRLRRGWLCKRGSVKGA